MGSYQVCKRSPVGINPDLLQCAPCPPPMVNYCEFRVHALAQNLSQVDISYIAIRCRYADAVMEDNCSQNNGETTTITAATPSSSPNTNYSTPSFDSNPQTKSPICGSVCLVIIVSAVLAMIILFMIIAVIIKRKRVRQKQQDDVEKPHGDTDTKVNNEKTEHSKLNTGIISQDSNGCNSKIQTEGIPKSKGEGQEQRPDCMHTSECTEPNAAVRQTDEHDSDAFNDVITIVQQNKDYECISRISKSEVKCTNNVETKIDDESQISFQFDEEGAKQLQSRFDGFDGSRPSNAEKVFLQANDTYTKTEQKEQCIITEYSTKSNIRNKNETETDDPSKQSASTNGKGIANYNRSDMQPFEKEAGDVTTDSQITHEECIATNTSDSCSDSADTYYTEEVAENISDGVNQSGEESSEGILVIQDHDNVDLDKCKQQC